MMEEELELIRNTSKEERKEPRNSKNTGTNTYKTSEKNIQKGVRDSFKQRCFSNTEKEYACLINKNPVPITGNPHQFIQSENDNHSFSFEKSKDSVNIKSIKEPRHCNN